MQLNLKPEDATRLAGLLRDYLPALEREVARTDAADVRHELARRRDLVERLVAQLPATAPR